MKISKIKKIEKPETTYNLHIKNNHNYVANGNVVSNCHGSKADALRAVLSDVMGDIKLRWGMTGTIPKDPIFATQIKLNIGPVISGIRAVDLQEKGVLSSCHVNIIQTASKFKFDSYAEEAKWLVTDETRMGYISSLIQEIGKTGNTLVLVDRIAAGEEILKNLGLPKENFVYGNTAKQTRKSMYDSITDVDNEILICSYGVASTGISISRLYNVVLIEPGKSFTKVIQSIGRGLRRAKDKDHVEIYDMCSTTKYSARHMRERKKFYAEAEYPFEHLKITDWEDEG